MSSLTAKDKLEIARNLKEAGFDMSGSFIGDAINQIEKYWKRRKFTASDNPIPQAVREFVAHPKGKGYLMVFNDGTMKPVSQQFFDSESAYNFLPERFRTLVPFNQKTVDMMGAGAI